MRILFTGASSFTGYWFVQTLAGVAIARCAPLVEIPLYRCSPAAWSADQPDPHRGHAPFGSEAFNLLQQGGPWDLLCHHAADTSNYRAAPFRRAWRPDHTEYPEAVLQALKSRLAVTSCSRGACLSSMRRLATSRCGHFPLTASPKAIDLAHLV